MEGRDLIARAASLPPAMYRCSPPLQQSPRTYCRLTCAAARASLRGSLRRLTGRPLTGYTKWAVVSADLLGLLGVDAGCWPVRGRHKRRLICSCRPALCAAAGSSIKRQGSKLDVRERTATQFQNQFMTVLSWRGGCCWIRCALLAAPDVAPSSLDPTSPADPEPLLDDESANT